LLSHLSQTGKKYFDKLFEKCTDKTYMARLNTFTYHTKSENVLLLHDI
jgi:hypothetical protein